MSFEQLRSGVWDNAPFSSMMDGQPIWWRLSKLTGAHGSEANKVIDRFKRLTAQERQDIVNFLRSL